MIPLIMQLFLLIVTNSYRIQWRSLNAEKVTHIKGRLLDHVVFSSIVSLFKVGTEGANYFLSEQFLTVWKIIYTTLGDPWNVTIFITHKRNCIIGATPMEFSF